MPYNSSIADRIRNKLVTHPKLKERQMMGGLVFMLNDKMCIGVFKDELMCRVDPRMKQEALERHGSRTMDMAGRIMKGYILVEETGFKTDKDFNYWIQICLDFNAKVKAPNKAVKTSANRKK